MRRLEKSTKRIYSTLLCILMCGLLSIANAGTRNVVRVCPDDLQGDGQTVYQRLREIHASALAKGSGTRVVYPKGMTVRIVIPSDAALSLSPVIRISVAAGLWWKTPVWIGFSFSQWIAVPTCRT